MMSLKVELGSGARNRFPECHLTTVMGSGTQLEVVLPLGSTQCGDMQGTVVQKKL